MLCKDFSGVWVDLALPSCLESSGTLESEFDSSDAGEQAADRELAVNRNRPRLSQNPLNRDSLIQPPYCYDGCERSGFGIVELQPPLDEP
jgi:hypothetical protein